jgi:16S rRNA G966 N2-methylase RsmD
MAKQPKQSGDKLFQHSGQNGPVECLGQTFPDDEARRKHFLDKLRAKLKDPAFRKIDGFPIGTDDDILALSDPPYYTACPNPFMADFMKHYGKPYDPKVPYSREPFAADVSEGKNHPIYSAHSYHTKVPHRAIMRYILHYTNPGDVVFDGFSGTGMTGVAAQLCGDKSEVQELGYRVLNDGTILDDEDVRFSAMGARRVVLNDLSPIATFIAHNYNTPFDSEAFTKSAAELLVKAKEQLGWMYETKHTDGRQCLIDFVIWSQLFSCPNCATEVSFSEEAIDEESGDIRETFPCPSCKSELTKRSMDKLFETVLDPATGKPWKHVRFKASEIHYRIGKHKYKKQPDEHDLALLKKVDGLPWPKGVPTNRFPIEQMYHGSRIEPKGYTHAHQFFFRRPTESLAFLWNHANAEADLRIAHALKFFVEQAITSLTVQNRYGPKKYSQSNGMLPLVYYIPSQIAEVTPWYVLGGKLTRLQKVFAALPSGRQPSFVSTGSTADLDIGESTLDYIFTDPPFGSNIFYADLNVLTESWHRVFTNSATEAVVDSFKDKALPEYHSLMLKCFRRYYRALKPGRWLTVEFSNSSASVWNAIQTTLQEAGFVVANVAALDKQQGSFRAVTTTTAVKQDLVISAYKPNGGFEERFQKEASTDEGVWDFVRTHLKYLPVVKRGGKSGQLITVTERDPRILFDRMVAYYVRSGFSVPLSSGEFQKGLPERFVSRDGMFFLSEQAAEYDKRRMLATELADQVLFVSDESSAIQWLRQVLKEKPQVFSEINPQFMQQLGGWSKHEEQLDLRELLQNFLCYDGKEPVPEQIHAYLSSNWKELRNLSKTDARLREKAKDRWYVPDPNKAGDLEKIREKDLLKVFEEYRVSKQRTLKVFRTEAVRAGFKSAYDRQDYKTIVEVAAKLPETVLQEDEKLLMYYDVATMRLGDEGKDKLFQ